MKTCWYKLCVGNWYNGGTGYTIQGSRRAVAAPQPSQIPGLGDRNGDVSTTDTRRPVVRDTDSAYVRLAKQGGQRNLLSMEPDDANVDVARRNSAVQQKPDWFYDNSGYDDNTAVSQLNTAAQYQRAAPQ